MTAQELLDQIQDGTYIVNFAYWIPYDEPRFYQIETMVQCLVTFDRRFRWTTQGWYKLTRVEQQQSKMDELKYKFHVLMTNPQLLQ